VGDKGFSACSRLSAFPATDSPAMRPSGGKAEGPAGFFAPLRSTCVKEPNIVMQALSQRLPDSCPDKKRIPVTVVNGVNAE